ETRSIAVRCNALLEVPRADDSNGARCGDFKRSDLTEADSLKHFVLPKRRIPPHLPITLTSPCACTQHRVACTILFPPTVTPSAPRRSEPASMLAASFLGPRLTERLPRQPLP